MTEINSLKMDVARLVWKNQVMTVPMLLVNVQFVN
jgi:hypothetical protein